MINKSVFIKNKGSIVRLDLDSIVYVKSDGDYCQIICVDQKYTIYNRLYLIENNINSLHFFRAHKSYLININYVDEINKSSVIVNETILPISRRGKKDLLEAFLAVDLVY